MLGDSFSQGSLYPPFPVRAYLRFLRFLTSHSSCPCRCCQCRFCFRYNPRVCSELVACCKIQGSRKYRRCRIPYLLAPSRWSPAWEGYGMERLFFPVLSLALQWFGPRYKAEPRFLEAQIPILRFCVNASRIPPTPKEQAELFRLGTLLGHDVSKVMHVVRPESYPKRVRKSRRVAPFKASGRPRTEPHDVRPFTSANGRTAGGFPEQNSPPRRHLTFPSHGRKDRPTGSESGRHRCR